MQNCSNALRQLFLRRSYAKISPTQIKKLNYYEVLNLRNDCNNKDIRNAYVELTKKFHPDVGGEASNKKFVQISEAYNVLSKPHMRASYDQQLLAKEGRPHNAGYGKHTTETHRPWEIKPDYNPNPGPYYGVNGVPRVSNFKIALFLLVMGIFFSIVGFSSVSHSFAFNQTELDRKSAEASLHHASVRADAEKFTNEEQLKRMVERMISREEAMLKKVTTE